MAKEHEEQGVLSANFPTEGIDKLYSHQRDITALGIDEGFFTSSQRLKPIIRGTSRSVEASLSGLLKTDVFQWSQVDPAGLSQAAQRDPELAHSLSAMSEIVNTLEAKQASGNLDPSTKQLLTLALTEKAVEATSLGAPYIPRSTKTLVEDLIKAASEDQSHTIDPGRELRRTQESLLDQFRFWVQQYVPKPPQGMPSLPSFLDKWRAEPLQKPRKKGSKTRNSEKNGNNGFYSHPLLEEEQEVGRERKWKLSKSKQKMIEYRGPFYEGDAFIVTRINNRYDQKRGLLSVDSTKVPLEFCPPSSSMRTISAPIGAIDALAYKEIAIPVLVSDSGSRWSEYGYKRYLSGVELQSEKQGIPILDSLDLRRAIETDGLGNASINLERLSREQRREITGKRITVYANYTEAYPEDRTKTRLPVVWIGPMPDEEKYRLNLYPQQIADFIQTLKHKKEKGAFGRFIEDISVFIKLVQFIGNFWLTYDLQDASFQADDPIGFHQTERVLARRRASCEGANIALGQLMRYFLTENEGIAYAEGFVIQKSGNQGFARPGDFHLKVLYKDKLGAEHFFDATPWLDLSKDRFNTATQAYRETKNDWLVYSRPIHDKQKQNRQKQPLEPSSTEKAESVTQRLFEAWWPLPVRENIWDNMSKEGLHSHNKKLPGSFGEQEFLDLFGVTPIELDEFNFRRAKNRPLRERLRREKREVYVDNTHSQNLLRFLKKLQDIDSNIKQYWPDPRSPLDGQTYFALRFLDHPMYGISGLRSMDVNKYFEDRGRTRLFRDCQTRQRAYRDMVTVMGQAMAASEQNISAVNYLADCVEDLSKRYQARLWGIFASVADRMPVDFETFMQQAPFMMLLPHPLKKLEDTFFKRSFRPGREGFLDPYTERDIKKRFDLITSRWKIEAANKLDDIEDHLEEAPLTTDKPRARLEVSSIQHWEQVIADLRTNQAVPRETEYLDPIDTFVFLYKNLRN